MLTRREALMSFISLAMLPSLSPRTAYAAQGPAAASAAALTTGASVAQHWSVFRSRFMTADGRIVDTGNQGISHTEGQGVALLAAAACGDEQSFGRLWSFTRTLRREDGLFSWKFVPGQGIADTNNASDGDQYIAWALLQAARNFAKPAWREEAAGIIRALRQKCLVEESHGLVLLPGVNGFRVDAKAPPVVNPSYWVYPALAEFASIDDAALWGRCVQAGLNLANYAYFGRYRLPADWLSLTDPVAPWAQRPARFGYEAIRVPLFLYWTGQTGHACLSRFAAFAHAPGFPAWVDFDDRTVANYPAPPGFEAVAQLARAATTNVPVNLPDIDSDYFSASLTLLSSLAVAGRNTHQTRVSE
jgi:endoglucanase